MRMQMSPHSIVTLSAVALFGLAVGSPADAGSLSRNPNPPTVSTGSLRPALPLNAVSITQSASLVPVAGSISCNNTTPLHHDNSYWRAFTLSDFSALNSVFFIVESVDVGVETANASGTGTPQPITLRLYSQTGAAFPGGARTLLATENVLIPDQTLTLLNIPLTTPVPLLNASGVLVVELFTPSGIAAGHSFVVGANPAGQLAPSYISAADCGIATPTDLAALATGLPNMHIVMQVNGQNQLLPVELQGFTVE